MRFLLFWVIFVRFRTFLCDLVGCCTLLRVFAYFSALGVPLVALGALLGALGTLLGRSRAKIRKSIVWNLFLEVFWGRGFGKVLATLNVRLTSLRLRRPSHRNFYVFSSFTNFWQKLEP